MAIRDPIPRKLTYEDYVRFPDDGLRHELIDGEHFVSPGPIEKHQLVSWNFDPAEEIVRVFRASGLRLAEGTGLAAAAGDVLETPLLPGLAIPLAEVFRE